MKRFLLLALLIPHVIFAEDIYFKVIETTPAWEDINFPKPDNISGEILQGSIVKGYSGIDFSSLVNIYENIPFQTIFYNDKKMKIYAKSIIPLETKDLFDKELLYNPDKLLVYSFFMNALLSNDRKQIYLYDKIGWDDFLASQDWQKEQIHYGNGDWLMQYVAAESMQITQTAINIFSGNKYGISLLIKNIIKTKDGYSLTVKGEPFFREINDRWWKWSVPEGHELFNILLVIDADYIDLYLENKNSLIETFVFVNKETANQINNLIRGYPVDLTNISFPRRADGSTDYQLPVNDVEDKIPKSAIEKEAITQTNDETSSLPFWVWIAIIGGAVVVVGAGVAVFALKRKG